MRFVLDADVVIGALDGSDQHHEQARRLFRTWERQDATRLISVVNLTEILVAPAGDQHRLRAAREAIAALGITIQRPGETIAVEAARLRGRYPISVPDAYCLATARYADAAVATFDEKVQSAAQREGIAAADLPRRPRR